MEADCYGPESLLLKSPEVNCLRSYKLLDPYSSGSSISPSPEARRLQLSGDKSNILAKSLLSTPIKMEAEDEVYIIDGIPVQEPDSGSDMFKSSGSSIFSTKSNSTASMSSGSGSSGSGNWKSKMRANRTRFGHCMFAHSEEELLSGIPKLTNLSWTETPEPLSSSTGTSSALSQFARPYVPASISNPSLQHQMFVPSHIIPNPSLPHQMVRPPPVIPNPSLPHQTVMPNPSLPHQMVMPSPIHHTPYYGSSNPMEPASVQDRQPIERNSYVTTATAATAPIKVKPPSEPSLKPVYEQVNVKPPSEPINTQASAESTPGIAKAMRTRPTTPPGFSYWAKPHLVSKVFKGETLYQPINIQSSSECSDADMVIPKGPTAALPSDWCPSDDGIQVTLPGNDTPSREEEDDYINKVPMATNIKKRLPAFKTIFPHDD